MSKKSKRIAKDMRKKAKRNKKEAERAKYAAWRDAGTNKKSKRSVLRASRTLKSKNQSHVSGPCGNHGCFRCFPNASNDPFRAPEGSPVYHKLFTSPQYRTRKPKPWRTSLGKMRWLSRTPSLVSK
jgi:hypothetical protein